jgi:hypothetical protein
MPVFKGSVSGSILQVALNIPCEVLSYSLVNKTGGSVTATVYVRDADGLDIQIDRQTLAANATYISGVKIKLLGFCSIYLVVSGQVDYYFSIQ